MSTTPNGLTIYRSDFGPKATMERLESAVTAKGMAVLARIDHAAAAAKVGMEMRPTEVLVFGNASAGTPLMQMAQTLGIDLPLKALVWQDEDGVTWLGTNDPAWLAERHGIDAETHPAGLAKMTSALASVAAEATRSDAKKAP